MTQTWAAIRTRPTAFVSDLSPEPNLLRVVLTIWKLQARRVRTLA